MGAIMFLKPWHAVDGDRRTHLEAALALEIKPGHVLAGRAIHVLAARQDFDDVLCEIGEGSCAIVHMTWSGKAESAPLSKHEGVRIVRRMADVPRFTRR